MNRILFGIFAVGLLFALGEALKCYKCDLGIGNLCITTQVTCNEGEQCFSGIGEAASFLPIKSKGCLAVAECNKVSEVTFTNNTLYHMNKTCCAEDLCNSAPRLSAPVFLPLTMATISASLLMSRALI